jgi:hypothetical protein
MQRLPTHRIAPIWEAAAHVLRDGAVGARAAECARRNYDDDALVRAAADTLMISLPLIITEEQIEAIFSTIRRALQAILPALGCGYVCVHDCSSDSFGITFCLSCSMVQCFGVLSGRVDSCAQIGKDVHISGGVGIGGVLEPLQAGPVIIEDDCFIGAFGSGRGRDRAQGRSVVDGRVPRRLDVDRRSRNRRDLHRRSA